MLLCKICKATTIDKILSYEQDLSKAYSALVDNLLENNEFSIVNFVIIPAFESHRIRYAEPPNPSGGAMRNQIPFRCSEPYPTMNLRQLCRTH